ncbi:MAG: alpha,alpha-trehalase TreF [Candidatus Saccharimonadales bacterium]
MKDIIHKLKSRVEMAGSSLVPTPDSPDEVLGELFHDVQLGRVHLDGKTFVDAIPKAGKRKILTAYLKNRQNPNFDLKKFVEEHFQAAIEAASVYQSNPENNIQQHINELWPVLTKQTSKNIGSLIALPHSYIVPGGRFKEQFYWDTYFIMLGLAEAGQWELIDGTIKNYAYMIRKFDYIPTANRTYLLSRSQPPFFAAMVKLLASHKGKLTLVRYLPYLLAEHKFWMKGSKNVTAALPANRRVVRMPDGSLLNRYSDSKRTPRPESFKEDVETAHLANGRLASQVYADIRAAAESGWDFSARWFKDGMSLRTIHTTDIVPVDLNCLLYELEQTIAEAYHILKQSALAKKYEQKAKKRAEAINRWCWSKKDNFYMDYDFVEGAPTPRFTLAGAFPLYVGIAAPVHAATVADKIKKDFLKKGGLVATLDTTGQQWDAPNGWAPLHWTTVQGLQRYDEHDLADEIKNRWIQTNLRVFKTDGKLVEKYNVVDGVNAAGGGEYPLQDGFGWTNGVLLAFLSEDALH